MYSRIDIYNLALGHLGHSETVSDANEGTVEAQACNLFYDASLDEVLGKHAWGFVDTKDYLALKEEDYFSYRYAYLYPANAHKITNVFHKCSREPQEFLVKRHGDGSRIIVTNVENAIVQYTSELETGLFPIYFARPLSYKLAYNTYHLIVDGSVKKQDLKQEYMEALIEGATEDANEMCIDHYAATPMAEAMQVRFSDSNPLNPYGNHGR